MRKKCYIYTRVSTAAQTEGYSLEAQTERLRKYAEYKEMEVVREYCDAGRSGMSIKGRPAFMEMMDDISCEKDEISCVLVFKLSRFGRNAADVLNSLQFIQDYGVNLVCVEDGIDSSKDSGKLTITVLSAVAEIERENILVQTMEGRKQKAREGKWNGGQAPFGYDLDSRNSTLVVNEEEAEIVNEETWEAAREKRKRTGVRFVKTHSLEHEHILTGLIRCPLCGGGMSGTVQRRQNKKTGEYKDTFYYRCHHRKKVDGKICDYKPMLNQKMFNAEVEEFIRYMVAGDEFRRFVQEKLEEKVDVSALETEREQLQKQLKQVQGSKLKLIQMLDRLDTGDKHYTRKYQDMQDRLDILYDKVAEFEEAMKDIDAKIGASYGKEITGKKLYEFLLDFDILYDKMTDMEKKEFMNTFIEKIELKNETVNNGTGQGSRIEHIDLAFPVYYGDCKGTRIRMPEENTVETVVLLSQLKQKLA